MYRFIIFGKGSLKEFGPHSIEFGQTFTNIAVAAIDQQGKQEKNETKLTICRRSFLDNKSLPT